MMFSLFRDVKVFLASSFYETDDLLWPWDVIIDLGAPPLAPLSFPPLPPPPLPLSPPPFCWVPLLLSMCFVGYLFVEYMFCWLPALLSTCFPYVLALMWAGTGTLLKFGLCLGFLNVVQIRESYVARVLAWCSSHAVNFISLLTVAAPHKHVVFVSVVSYGDFSVCWCVKWGISYLAFLHKMKYILFFMYSLYVLHCYLSLWLCFDVCVLASTSCIHSSPILFDTHLCWGWGGDCDSGSRWANHRSHAFGIWCGDKL
jgi:hypothetical protein